MLVIRAERGRTLSVAIISGCGEGSAERVASVVGVGVEVVGMGVRVGEGFGKPTVGLAGARGVATCACRHPASSKMAIMRVEVRKDFVIMDLCLRVMG
jgi:hypothetical protein